jgi:L-lactate dehydrogenase complex protein LldG
MADALSARVEILARIRSAIGNPNGSSAVEQGWQAIPREYRRSSTLSRESCLHLFQERLIDYGTGVYHSESAQIGATIALVLRHRNKKRVLVSPDIDSSWLQGGECEFVRDHALSYEEIDGCDGVITGCTVAIAATGTLGLCHIDNQLGQGRRALTLIPDYHLCVVSSSAVVETVPEAMHVLEHYRNRPITFVSGPSATADIEMTRIQGVHGPRTLDVLILD